MTAEAPIDPTLRKHARFYADRNRGQYLPQAGHQVLSWWKRYFGPGDGAGSGHNLRGQAATLRRCTDPAGAALCAAFQDLRQDLTKLDGLAHGLSPSPGASPDRLGAVDGLARVALVLSYVRRDAVGPRGFGGQLHDGGFSKLRLQALLQRGETDAELVRELRRAVAILDGTADVAALAELAFWWRDPEQGEHVRKLLAFGYYDALAADEAGGLSAQNDATEPAYDPGEA